MLRAADFIAASATLSRVEVRRAGGGPLPSRDRGGPER
jgi:hypothetical protein